MEAEIRQCNSCKVNFEVAPEDFAFYEKIMVPAPTWCPECRFKRRMCWKNSWHAYQKSDARTGKKIASSLPEESPYKVIDSDYWYSGKFDGSKYARDYNWNRTFFEQFIELAMQVPLPSHTMNGVIDAQLSTGGTGIKNCNHVRACTDTEDSSYLISDTGSKNCIDTHFTTECEFCYDLVNCSRCFKCAYSVDCEDCQNMVYCRDCVNCHDCFGSSGLRNASYVFLGEQLSKERYLDRFLSLSFKTEMGRKNAEVKAKKAWLSRPVRYYHGKGNVNVSGDYINDSANVERCYRVRGLEDSKYCANILTGPAKDCYDYGNWGQNVEQIYESLVVGNGAHNIKFCWNIFPSCSNLTYSLFCGSSSQLFGCVGLNQKRYCILNKQYTKEEYEAMIPKIIYQMNTMPYRDRLGREYRYGEFFPPEFAPLPYNATEAGEFYPLTEEEREEQGFIALPATETEYFYDIPASKIPEDISDFQIGEILPKVIECAHRRECAQECLGSYQISGAELELCKFLKIPLPRTCFHCRHYERLKLRNTPKMRHRECMKSGCKNEFDSGYPHYRFDIVYCEGCYRDAVA